MVLFFITKGGGNLMNTLLVLYPIQPIADVLMGRRTAEEIKVKYPEIYQLLISKRYPDFRIVWMMFAKAESAGPDMSLLWRGISIKESDIVGSCGITFERQCKEKVYPDPKVILDFCPRPTEKLVIAGFHFWDCVEKVAKNAHLQGLNVLVDDDLTEFFFYKVRNHMGHPSSSRIPTSIQKSLEKDRKHLLEAGPHYLEVTREARRERPWLLPI
jgi:hypothetical protein